MLMMMMSPYGLRTTSTFMTFKIFFPFTLWCSELTALPDYTTGQHSIFLLLFMADDKVPNKVFSSPQLQMVKFPFFLLVFVIVFVWMNVFLCLFILIIAFKLAYMREETGRSVVLLHAWSLPC